MTSLIAIQNLSKTFPSMQQPALQNIEAEIPKGKIVGLVGPDGSGKTTLIRLMAGLLLPTQGSIHIAGHSTVGDAEEIHRLTGYMPQKFGLYEDLSVIQNLNLYADLEGVLGKQREERMSLLLKFTGLGPFTDRLAKNLSGGMKQKLGLACALIKKPSLLLLDEPSVGVDPISRRELWKMVHELLAEGISLIWSTAYLDEAERCDTVLLLHGGKLLYAGKPQDLTHKVEGRVFNLHVAENRQRQLLGEALAKDEVNDAIIQGKDVRLVIKENQSVPSSFGEGITIDPTLPRFEDAFIDLLGGSPKGISALAERQPDIKDGQEEIIITQNLTKKFGSFTAAENITCSIKRGEIFGLLGPNGAGKSTTFKMLCGLLKPTSGTAQVNGIDLMRSPGEARSFIGYMAQKFSLYGTLSVRQNLDFFAGIYNLKGKQKNDAIDAMIQIFSLQSYLNVSAELLPLGFKQRLSLACATMHSPEILFLDEPTSGVDPLTRREFWNHIHGLVGKGVTVMVTTHFMDEAEYCDRIALVYQGRIIHSDTPTKLKEVAKTSQNAEPSLEEAFITLIEEYDRKNGKTSG